MVRIHSGIRVPTQVLLALQLALGPLAATAAAWPPPPSLWPPPATTSPARPPPPQLRLHPPPATKRSTPPPPRPPPLLLSMPSWARGPAFTGNGAWKAFSVRQNLQNRQVVAAADAAGRRFDFLLYGDSITQLIFRESKAQWAALFPPSAGWLAAPLGVSGNDAEDLAWRLFAGGERPALAPRVIGLLIGTNNINAGTPLSRLDMMMAFLMASLRASFPDTQLLLINLLPRVGTKISPISANKRLRALAVRHGAAWSTCGRTINATDKAQLYDGTHPTPPVQAKLLRCLAPVVVRLAGKGPGQPPHRPSPPPTVPG